MADRYGPRRIFLIAMVAFLAGSALCGCSRSLGELVASRIIQGIGGGMMTPVGRLIVVGSAPRDRLVAAMSWFTMPALVGPLVGPPLAGFVLAVASWPWIFFINVPIGVFTFIFGRILIDENIGLGIRTGVDVVGSVLITVSLMIGIYAISTATQYHWLSPHTLGFVGASVVLLIAFFVYESRVANPIMPLRIFRIPTLTRSSIIRGMLATGMFTTFFLGALYLEGVLHYTPVQTGLAFLPMSISMGILSAGITARLVTRYGDKRVLIPGMVAGTIGLLWLTQLGTTTSYVSVMLPAFLLIGIGAGTAFAPLLSIAMADVPVADAGLGSGIVNVSIQMASALGLALLSVIATGRTHALEAAGHPAASAMTDGYRLAFLISAILVAAGTVVAALALDKSTPRSLETPLEVHLAEEALSAASDPYPH